MAANSRNVLGKSLLLLVVMGALLLVGLGTRAFAAPPAMNASPPPAASTYQVQTNPLVRTAVRSDVSPPLRDIAAHAPFYQPSPLDHDNPHIAHPSSGVPAVDTAIQSLLGPLAMPTPIQNIEAQFNQYGPIPPDTNGDVGRQYYVQTVNSGFEAWDKATGAVYFGPVNMNTLWTGFGGVCERNNDGDVIGLYDPMADRWLISEFGTTSAPSHQCIAISTSPDPAGSYYRYDFLTSNSAFEDYPHFGVWPDAYYMTANEFGGSNGGGNFAFERARMLVGDPGARMVYFATPADATLLPSDMDGAMPPAGSPNYFLNFYDASTLHEFRFHVDWTTPANSTFTGPIAIQVTPFNFNTSGVPQPGVPYRLDDLSDRLMYRLAYRNMGSYESLVVNHTVLANGVDGVRWYEIRSPGGTPTVFQQSTYAPNDGLYRWMGSVAMDRVGDMALGFNFGSGTQYASIAYAGRLVSDPPNEMTQGEATLWTGTGAENYSTTRWGDYSSITVDPTDDCTFWYTTEYFARTGLRNWRTRVGSFKFPSCSGPASTPVPTATGGVPTATPTPVIPTPCPGYVTYTGSITNTDTTQTGRLGLFDPKSLCGAPKSCSSVSDNNPRHYDSYTYTNNTGVTECVTVHIDQACSDNAIQSVTYLGSFNPSSLCTNYLADGGGSGAHFSYSFSLANGQTAVVVVVEVSPNLGCESYSLSINPCGPTPPSPTPGGPTDTPVPTSTPIPTDTPVPTDTPMPATSTDTPVPTATVTPCMISFSDVDPSNPFYGFIRCLACRGIVSGYADGTYRPGNLVTRGQMSKFIANAAGYTDVIPPAQQTFSDVPPSHPFWVFVERAYLHGVISGYADGTFQPGNLVTRGQATKFVSNAAGYADVIPPAQQTFSDVPPSHPFWLFVERVYLHGVISGYADGTFRPGNLVTRGQTAKFIANAFFPGCVTPAK